MTKQIENKIKSLKLKNSQGCDKISTKVLKTSSPFVSSSLNYICSKTLYRHFPRQMEILNNKTIYEKCNKYDVSNCRPVSLLK